MRRGKSTANWKAGRRDNFRAVSLGLAAVGVRLMGGVTFACCNGGTE